mmetsp:Transcript_26733/g.75532  ORF Transcript_26733/g.75532 Transcript_26733/m.75532 type:complete len:312 (-) Transcript_26733:2-937(-)
MLLHVLLQRQLDALADVGDGVRGGAKVAHHEAVSRDVDLLWLVLGLNALVHTSGLKTEDIVDGVLAVLPRHGGRERREHVADTLLSILLLKVAARPPLSEARDLRAQRDQEAYRLHRLDGALHGGHQLLELEGEAAVRIVAGRCTQLAQLRLQLRHPSEHLHARVHVAGVAKVGEPHGQRPLNLLVQVQGDLFGRHVLHQLRLLRLGKDLVLRALGGANQHHLRALFDAALGQVIVRLEGWPNAEDLLPLWRHMSEGVDLELKRLYRVRGVYLHILEDFLAPLQSYLYHGRAADEVQRIIVRGLLSEQCST